MMMAKSGPQEGYGRHEGARDAHLLSEYLLHLLSSMTPHGPGGNQRRLPSLAHLCLLAHSVVQLLHPNFIAQVSRLDCLADALTTVKFFVKIAGQAQRLQD